jgi:hypothetical protein
LRKLDETWIAKPSPNQLTVKAVEDVSVKVSWDMNQPAEYKLARKSE